MRSLLIVLSVLLLNRAGVYAQATPPTAEKSSFLNKPAPQTPVPGIVIRVHINTGPDARKTPTHLVAVVKDGDDYNANVKTPAKDELRGVVTSTDTNYIATGLLVLEKDTDVRFKIGDGACLVNKKDFGNGTYVKNLKKGKYTVEILRQWGKGQGGFSITDDATGESVLFYTGEQLNRELNRGIKIEGRTLRTKLVGTPATAEAK